MKWILQGAMNWAKPLETRFSKCSSWSTQQWWKFGKVKKRKASTMKCVSWLEIEFVDQLISFHRLGPLCVLTMHRSLCAKHSHTCACMLPCQNCGVQPYGTDTHPQSQICRLYQASHMKFPRKGNWHFISSFFLFGPTERNTIKNICQSFQSRAQPPKHWKLILFEQTGMGALVETDPSTNFFFFLVKELVTPANFREAARRFLRWRDQEIKDLKIW